MGLRKEGKNAAMKGVDKMIVFNDFKPCRKRCDSRRGIKIFTFLYFLRVPSRSREFTKVSISTECPRAHKSTENLCESSAITFPHFARLCLQSQIEILNAHVFAQGRTMNETANKVSPSKNVKSQGSKKYSNNK